MCSLTIKYHEIRNGDSEYMDEREAKRATSVMRQAVGHTVFFQSPACREETWGAVKKYLIEVPEQGRLYTT